MKLNDKDELKQFRLDFAKAVEDLETQYNIKINLGNISYTEAEFHAKLSVTTGDEEERADQERMKFALLAPRYGFKPEDFMIQVKGPKGKRFELVGFNTKARKNPCVLREIATGDMASCPTGYVDLNRLD